MDDVNREADETESSLLASPAVADMLMEMLLGEAVADIDLPHVVVAVDTSSHVATVTGPYVDGLTALLAAEHDRAAELAAGGPIHGRLVMRLLAP
jgi:hypothetical protein